MSKKQPQYNRLKTLFDGLDGQNQSTDAVLTRVQVAVPALPLVGWTWELDSEGNFIACSDELIGCLGVQPGDFIGRPMRTYRLNPQSVSCMAEVLDHPNYPAETVVQYRHNRGNWVPVRIHVLSGPGTGNPERKWRGFAQTLPADEPSCTDGVVPVKQPPPVHEESPNLPETPRIKTKTKKQTGSLLTVSQSLIHGISVNAFGQTQADHPITSAGMSSLALQELTASPSSSGQPASLAVPFHAGEFGDMLLEVVDDLQDRKWTEDERQMANEVAGQLALALENARLYLAAQQELSDRVRAEEVILHRNQDLATLNRIGQRLSGLISRSDVYNLLFEFVGQVLDNRSFYIGMYDRHRQTLTFPIYREDGLLVQVPDRPLSNELVDHVINTRASLLLSEDVGKRLVEMGVILPPRTPAALMAIPIVASDSYSGALVIQNFDPSNTAQFDPAHLELLSTVAAQAGTALENSRLFEQMQEAMRAIENRERYQGGVAQAAGSLSEFGSQSLGDVLKYLGHAAQASRVYLLQYVAADHGSTWKLVEDWTSPMVAYLFDRSKIHNVAFDIFAGLINDLRINGWQEIQAARDMSAAGTFLRSQNLQTSLVLAVQMKGPMPALLVFDQIDRERQWLNDEINILRVAADAIANTYIREDLLNQLQLNLDETESLYEASNHLVLAADYQEMLSAVINGVKASGLNRAILLNFETDAFAKLIQMTVQGNWYSGYGTPPPPVGSIYPIDIYGSFLQTPNPIFIENISGAMLDEALHQSFLDQNTRSLAVLPMWSGKRQIGALLLAGEQNHLYTGRETRTLPPLADQLTISVENMRLFEQTQTALAETALLYNISSSIAQAQTADDMVRLVVDTVMPRGADKAALMLTNLSPENEILDIEIVGFQDMVGDMNLKGTRMQLEELPVIRMLTDEGLVISDTATTDPASIQTFDRFGVKAITFVPLRTSGRLIGVLSASSRKPTQYDPADVRLLRTVANGIAVALEKQRLLREAERRALELQTASEIARDTTSTLSLDLLLNRIVNLLSERFGYDHTSIYFLDETRSFAVLREASGEAGAEIKRRGHRVMIGSRSVIGTVASSASPILLNDIATSPIYISHPLLPDTRSEMALPLKIGKRNIGVLDIQSNQANTFKPEDVNVLGILVDQISIAIENARAYELSQKAIEDMREVDRVKSQFLANMSHELRTPLNSIIGFSRVILKGIDGPTTEMQQQDLSAIYSSGQHLLLLINDILDLSKIEAGKMELAFSDVNLGDMINSAMSTATGLVKDKPIRLETQIPKNLPLVRADTTRLRQVMINFLSNAAKFTEEGTITVAAMETKSPQGEAEIMVTVSDTGPGIAEADQVKLFLPFSQVDDSSTRKTGGTGLGLSICRSLIDLHHGRIGLLVSKVGAGSTFYFTLPLPKEGKGDTGLTPSSTTEKPVILSIDDDLQVISLYQRYLQPQGYTVLALTDPRVAVETARNCRPIAITLDVMMPERDGWKVMQDLKNDPVTRDIPIIVCSLVQDEEKGFSLGATDYLVKPFLQDELLNIIGRLTRTADIQRILVIDDDMDDLRLIKKMLAENHHLQVSLAQGGKNGLVAVKREKPDAIILDLMMPDLDGFELLAKMRLDPTLDLIPVVILSGADLTPQQHQKLAELGKELLSKSYLREKELINTIEQALRRIRPATVNS